MPGVIRRLFTVASVFAFALLSIVRLLGDGDPRYSILGFGFILHPENRMAISLPGGKIWAFNYAALYIPLTACFLISSVWNCAVWRRKRPDLALELAIVLAGAVSVAFALFSIAYPETAVVHLGFDISLASFLALLIVHNLRRKAALRRAREPHPHCHHCQYDLTGNVSGTCPECGTPTTIKEGATT